MKEKTYLFILSGEAFSGKTTLAKKLAEKYNVEIIGRDRVYFSLDPFLALEETPENEEDSLWKNLWPIVLQGIKNQLLLGKNIICDDNCFRLNQREELRRIARETRARFRIIYLATSPETIRARKEKNKITKERHDVPSSWMKEDAVLFERPTEDENPLVVNEDTDLDDVLRKLDHE